MAYKIKGRVLHVGRPQTIKTKSGSAFEKRDLVIVARRFDPMTGEPTEDPDNTPKFTFGGERCRELDGVKVGDTVTVSFDIQGRRYDRDGAVDYFTDVRPFRVDLEPAPKIFSPVENAAMPERQTAVAATPPPAYMETPDPEPQPPQSQQADDDLPF